MFDDLRGHIVPPNFNFETTSSKRIAMMFRLIPGVLVLFSLLIVGCSGDSGDGYSGPRGEVTGKVTFEGKPIPEGSTIMFESKTGKAGYTATGTINGAGEYKMQYNGKPNLPGVTYQVQIFPPSKASSAPADPAAGTNVSVEAEAPPFPAKYSGPVRELTFAVKEGKNTANFVLTK